MKIKRFELLLALFPFLFFLPLIFSQERVSVVFADGMMQYLFLSVVLLYCPVILPIYFASNPHSKKRFDLSNLMLKSSLLAIFIFITPVVLIQTQCFLMTRCSSQSLSLTYAFLMLLIYNVFMTYLLSVVVGLFNYFRVVNRRAVARRRK